MARVKFNPDSSIQSISGSIGNLTFRTVNGQTFVHSLSIPCPPKNSSRMQKERYRRRLIVNHCTQMLQVRIPNLQQAIDARPRIRVRVLRLYKLLAPKYRARTKLQKAIIAAYDQNTTCPTL